MLDGDPVPPPWRDVPEVRIDDETLLGPAAAVAGLHDAWLHRRAIVVRLAVDPAAFRDPVSYPQEPWTVDAGFETWDDRLHFLVWTNTYDARDGREPVWWWTRKAERVGATATPAGPADVRLPDGTPAWVDGGPRDVLELEDAVVHRESVDLGRLTPLPPALFTEAVDLAPDQRAAVLHGRGPARVIAPAGSGKTRVLTERLRHLLGDRGVEPETALAVAYNKKAQEELQERCARFRPRADTLNALGYDLVARHAGTRPNVIEEREVRAIVEALVPRQQRRANVDPFAPYIEALSTVRLGLVDPDVVEAGRDDIDGFAAAFGPYRAELRRRGVVDFDDQVYGAIEALLHDGPFRRAQQARHRHLLVDEFQDLTPAHVLLVRLLAAPELDVFGVGDDDQVIYGHAGADPGYLIDFERFFPGAADHPLTVNYRCPVAVVDGARTLLAYNHRRVPKEIRPGPDAVDDPDALTVVRHRPEAGATAVLDAVRGWLDAGADPASVAVLTRVNSLLLAPQVVLTSAEVPVTSILDPAVLTRTGVRAALAYLRIGASPGGFAPADVIEVLRRPSRGLPTWIEKWFRGRSMRVREVWAVADRLDDGRVADKVRDLAADLDLVTERATRGTTRDVLRAVKDDVGLGSAMGLLDSSGGSASHLDDLEALEQVALLHPDPAGFEPWLRSVVRRETQPGGVTLSTVHRVKGREWDHVVVYGATSGLLPHRLAEDVEEERRVFHVAITRSRRRAVVLADIERPSLFLAELAGTAPRGRERPPERPPARSRDRAGKVSTRSSPTVELSAEDAPAFEALRAWRLDRATRDKVPPYVVLHDSHLKVIARARPPSMVALSRCEGMGPKRLELYGDEILATLAELA